MQDESLGEGHERIRIHPLPSTPAKLSAGYFDEQGGQVTSSQGRARMSQEYIVILHWYEERCCSPAVVQTHRYMLG